MIAAWVGGWRVHVSAALDAAPVAGTCSDTLGMGLLTEAVG